jgi:hypothetical protein
MKLSNSLIAATLVWMLSGWALAQDGEETIVLLPEGAEQPVVVTGAIDLPKDADDEYIPSEEGVKNSADGLAAANAARDNGRAFGEEMAARAQESRENYARGARPDLANLLPGQVPGDVSLPDMPERPSVPVTPPAGP